MTILYTLICRVSDGLPLVRSVIEMSTLLGRQLSKGVVQVASTETAQGAANDAYKHQATMLYVFYRVGA
jgi:hypothetical protein